MRNQFIALSMLCAGLVLTSCGNEASEGPQASNEAAADQVLTLYSARHYDGDQAIYDAFEAETGIEVRARESRAPQLLETMKAEGDASPADVIIAADAGTLWRFKDAGLTQQIASDALDAAVPSQFKDPDGHWFGLAKRYRVIAYDTERVTEADVDAFPKLATADFEGEICARSSSNIYNLSLLGHLMETIGADSAESWADAVSDNFARDPAGGDTDQIKAVAAGACSVAIANHYYWFRLATSGSEADREVAAKTAIVFADTGDGPHANVTAGAVAANAPNAEAAVAFLEFLATPRGQEMLIAETKEYPIVGGVALPDGLTPAPTETSSTNLARFGENQVEAQRIYDRAGWP
ncbi:MAG: extracellular solute-binding protein [Pseudomonadota bacterium]